MPINLNGANIHANTSSLAIAALTTKSDTQIKAATTYEVVGVEPDGTGITALTLEKQ